MICDFAETRKPGHIKFKLFSEDSKARLELAMGRALNSYKFFTIFCLHLQRHLGFLPFLPVTEYSPSPSMSISSLGF